MKEGHFAMIFFAGSGKCVSLLEMTKLFVHHPFLQSDFCFQGEKVFVLATIAFQLDLSKAHGILLSTLHGQVRTRSNLGALQKN